MDVRDRIHEFLERAWVRNGIIGVILFNAVLLGMETSPAIMDRAGPLITALDRACLAVFVMEIGLKLVAYRLAFFKSGWNLFDFAIVGISLVPGAQAFSVLRAMRILRSRLLEAEEQRIAAERSEARRSLVGTGDRNERVRTYNFPQNRVTDHRLEDGDRKNFNLDGIIEGRLAPLFEALEEKDRRTRLANL